MSGPAPIFRRPPAPLLPAEDARDRALVFVVAVLCFIAGLALVSALAADRIAHGWRTELRGSATVVVRPGPDETPDAAAARAADALAGVKGVGEVEALEKEKAEALLEPWLGKDLPDDLAIPRLVAVDLDPKAPAGAAAMEDALKAANVDATVDDHSLWLKDILRTGLLAQTAAIAVAALIAAAAAAVIALATRAGLQARGDLVGVLHLAGAEDGYIAALFQLRFGRMAAIAGLIGAGAAAIVAATMRLLGGDAGLIPVLPVAWSDLVPLIACPLAAGAVAALAARVTALSLLKEMT
ncbi:MAG TPA: ABC transporter permease [Caulobacteraceae bacterium]|nr:ABC transporter permease [Caulobacteraceae bacterium]